MTNAYRDPETGQPLLRVHTQCRDHQFVFTAETVGDTTFYSVTDTGKMIRTSFMAREGLVNALAQWFGIVADERRAAIAEVTGRLAPEQAALPGIDADEPEAA